MRVHLVTPGCQLTLPAAVKRDAAFGATLKGSAGALDCVGAREGGALLVIFPGIKKIMRETPSKTKLIFFGSRSLELF